MASSKRTTRFQLVNGAYSVANQELHNALIQEPHSYTKKKVQNKNDFWKTKSDESLPWHIKASWGNMSCRNLATQVQNSCICQVRQARCSDCSWIGIWAGRRSWCVWPKAFQFGLILDNLCMLDGSWGKVIQDLLRQLWNWSSPSQNRKGWPLLLWSWSDLWARLWRFIPPLVDSLLEVLHDRLHICSHDSNVMNLRNLVAWKSPFESRPSKLTLPDKHRVFIPTPHNYFSRTTRHDKPPLNPTTFHDDQCRSEAQKPEVLLGRTWFEIQVLTMACWERDRRWSLSALLSMKHRWNMQQESSCAGTPFLWSKGSGQKITTPSNPATIVSKRANKIKSKTLKVKAGNCSVRALGPGLPSES